MKELLLHSPFIIYSQLQSGSVEKLIKYLFTITKWFTCVWNGAIRSCYDTSVLMKAQTMILNFLYHHRISIMLLFQAIQINKIFLLHIDLHETWSFYHMSQFENALPPLNKQKKFNCWHASLRSVIEMIF